jgi:hypothetical protein
MGLGGHHEIVVSETGFIPVNVMDFEKYPGDDINFSTVVRSSSNPPADSAIRRSTHTIIFLRPRRKPPIGPLNLSRIHT